MTKACSLLITQGTATRAALLSSNQITQGRQGFIQMSVVEYDRREYDS